MSLKNVYCFPAVCLNHGQLRMVAYSVSVLFEVVLLWGGGRKNKRRDQAICQGWLDAGAFSPPSGRKEELFCCLCLCYRISLQFTLFQTVKELGLFWHSVGFLIGLWFAQELYDFFFLFHPPQLDIYVGKCQVYIKHCQISEGSSSNYMRHEESL